MKLGRSFVLLAAFAAWPLLDCSSDGAAATPPASSEAGADAAAPTAEGGSDAKGAEAGEPEGPIQDEAEPNGGAETAGGQLETNAMTVPGTMRGTIDPADDDDIFTVGIKPGELWQYTLEGSGGYVPHVTVFDITPDNLNPTQLAKAGASGVKIELSHFVIRTGKFVAAVRDARNVPASSSSHAGGSDVKYSLVARKLAVQPTKVNLPETVTGSLATVSSVAIYSFTTTKNTNVEIVVRAARKSTPSELDSRMTLWNASNKTAVLTNDNAGGATKDSEIRGPMPTDGEYYVVLENEADMIFDPGATPDLSYEIEFSVK